MHIIEPPLVFFELLSRHHVYRWFWSSNDEEHADGNNECHGSDASGEAVGDDSNVICLNGSRSSQGIAQVAIYSQVASRGLELS
jgi:hypothetical protein